MRYVEKKCKIIKLKRDAEEVFDNALDYFDDGDYLKALSLAREAMRLDGELLDYPMTISEILKEMKLYEESISVVLNEMIYDFENAEGYLQIISNLAALEDAEAAEGYFRYAIKKAGKKKTDLFYDLDDGETLLQSLAARNSFVLLDREQKHKAALSWAETLLDSGEPKSALEILSYIPQNSKYYLPGINLRVRAMTKLKDFEDASALNDKILEKHPENANALICRLELAFAQKLEPEESFKSAVIESDDLMPGQMSRAASVFFDAGYHDEGLIVAEKYLKLFPFNPYMLILQGIGFYNTGHTLRAKRNMLAVLDILPHSAIARYFNIYFQKNPVCRKGLAYNLNIPKKETARILGLIDQTDGMTIEQIDKWYSHSENKFALDWAIKHVDFYGNREKLLYIAERLFDAETVIRENLVRLEVSPLSKREMLRILLRLEPEDEIGMTIGRKLSIFTPLKACIKSETLVHAYCEAIVSLAFFTVGFEKKLAKYAEKTESALLLSNINPECLYESTAALGAAFCLAAAGKSGESAIDSVAEVFGTAREAVEAFLEFVKAAASAGSGKKEKISKSLNKIAAYCKTN